MKTNVRAFYKHRDEELKFNGLNNKITTEHINFLKTRVDRLWFLTQFFLKS